ncbi:hypothetical protein XELAEV_18000554mg [Xenopus laevis]|nr:hypothetical protein XELAEV_18000554mg [Xenopus laevis]
MTLIFKALHNSARQTYDLLRNDISKIKKVYLGSIEQPEFLKFTEILNKKIERTEKELMDFKTNKFKRDKNDYESNKVYNWSRIHDKYKRVHTPDQKRFYSQKSILKPPKDKHVSFSGTDYNSFEDMGTGVCSSSPLSSQGKRNTFVQEVFSE